MSRLGLKKLIIFMLIAVSAIACFGATSIVSNQTKTNSAEQVLDFGLEYKDGYYLISDAEDYYIMVNNQKTGYAQGAKYRLTNNITVDPRGASLNVATGLTLDGAGYTITSEIDPEYKPDINMTSQWIPSDTASTSGDYLWKPITGSTAMQDRYEDLGIGNHLYNYGDGFSPAYRVYGYSLLRVMDVQTGVNEYYDNRQFELNSAINIDVANAPESQFPLSTDLGYELNAQTSKPIILAYGGLIGVAEDCELRNVYFKYNQSVSITTDQRKATVALGGLIGLAYNTSIYNCVVHFEAGKEISITDSYLGAKNNVYNDQTNTNGYWTCSSAWGYLVGEAFGGGTYSDSFIIADDKDWITAGNNGQSIIIIKLPALGGYGDANNVTFENVYIGSEAYFSYENSGNSDPNKSIVAALGSVDDGGTIAIDGTGYNNSNAEWLLYEGNNNDGIIIQKVLGTEPTYTVTFDHMADKTISIPSISAKYGETITLPSTSWDYGTFLGWSTTRGDVGIIGQAGDKYTVTKDVTLYAIWDANAVRFKLNFKDSDSDIKAEVVDANGWIYNTEYGWHVYAYQNSYGSYDPPSPPEIIRPGYTLSDWSTRSSLSNTGAFNASYSAGQTFYAIWEEDTYTVKFQMPDNSGEFYGMTADFYNRTCRLGIYYVTVIYKYGTLDDIYGDTVSILPTTYVDFSNYSKGIFDSANNLKWKVVEGERYWADHIGSEYTIATLPDVSVGYGNVTFEPMWEYKTYNIKFVLGEGEWNGYDGNIGDVDYNKAYTYGDTVALPTANQVVRPGYTLVGWSAMDDIIGFGKWGDALDPIVYGCGESLSNKYGNATITAVWEVADYEITIKTSEGSLASYSATYTDVEYGGRLISYSDQEVKLMYRYGDLDQGIDCISYLCVMSDVYGVSEWIRTDITLMWEVTAGDGTWKNCIGQTFEGNSNVDLANLGYYGDVTFEAVWEYVDYTITFDENGGELDAGDYPVDWVNDAYTKTYNYTSNFYLPSDQIRKDGYKFNGWKLETSVGNWEAKIYGSSTVAATISQKYGNVILVAQWGLVDYYINPDFAGGEISDYDKYDEEDRDIFYRYGDDFTLPYDIHMTKSGYTFAGWKITSISSGNWSTVCKVGEIIPNSATTGYSVAGMWGTINIEAQWTIATFTIEFDGNEESGGSTASVTATYGQTCTLTVNGFTKTGYTFAGWATSAAGSVAHANNATLTVAEVNGYYGTAGAGGTCTLYAVWEINTFEVTIKVNNSDYGSVNPTSIANVPYGSAITVNDNTITINGTTVTASATNATGYTTEFTSWGNATGTITANREITANFGRTPDTYTIAFNGNGNTSGSTASVTATYDQTCKLTTNGFERTGHTFKGWATSSTGSKVHDNNATLTASQVNTYYNTAGKNGTYTLYAVWQINTFEVTISVNNSDYGSVNPTSIANVPYGSEITTNNNTITINGTKVTATATNVTGYTTTFTSWGNATGTITANREITANFGRTPDTYTIAFNGNGNTSGSTASVTATYDQTCKLTTNGFERTGHTFKGWATSSIGSKVHDNNATLTASQVNTYYNTAGKNGTYTLYAVWEINKFTVTIKVNNSDYGSVDKSTISNVPYGSGITTNNNTITINGTKVTATATNVTGYTTTFTSWGNATGTITANREITANFGRTPDTYTIAFNGNGNTGGSTASVTATYDQSCALTANGFIKTGHTFAGWAISSTGSKVHDNNATLTASQVNTYYNTAGKNGTYTLYAVWTINPYTLTINPNGGIWNGSTSNSTITQDYATTYTVKNPTREGYTFTGWTHSGAGSFNDTTKIFTFGADNGTLTAQWTINSYTLTVDPNGGTTYKNIITPSSIAHDASGNGNNLSYTYNASTGVYTLTIKTDSDPYVTVCAAAELETGVTYVMNAVTDGSLQVFYGISAGYIEARSMNFDATINQVEFTVPTTGTYNFRFDNDKHSTLTVNNFWVAKKSSLTTNAYTQAIKYGESYQLPTPTRVGYTFDGWTATGGTENNSVFTIGAGNATLTAQWTADTFTIEFNGNGRTGGSTSAVTATYGQTCALTANGFTKTGHTFAGWAASSTGSVVHANSATLTASQVNVYYGSVGAGGTLILFAKWTADTFTIEFNGNGHTGGSTSAVTATYGQTCALTANGFTKTGHTFAGWAASSTGSVVHANSATLTASQVNVYYGSVGAGGTLILFAKWTADTFTIEFNGNGNTGGSTASATATYDQSCKLTANGFERTGHTFVGWATSSTGSKVYDNNATLTASQVNTYYNTAGKNGTYTLYAVWTINKYTLTIDPNGGIWNGSTANSIIKQDYATTYTVENPTREGYTFTGWTLSGAGSFEASTKVYTFGADDGTLTAQWTINKYTLTINPNAGTWNGSTANSTITQDYGTTYTVENPTRTGYTFTGWTHSGAGSFNDTTKIFTFGVGDGALTAQWAEDSYTITANPNSGTLSTPLPDGWTASGTNATKSVKYTATFGTLPNATRTGYTFVGWATTNKATEADVEENSKVNQSNPQNITIYAVWDEDSYTITANPNGGTISELNGWTKDGNNAVKIVKYTEKLAPLPTAELDGYKFKGWSTTQGETTPNITTESIVDQTTPQDMIIYAVFVEIEYIITFNGSGGNVVPNSMVYTIKTTINLNPTSATRTGYTFGGWAVNLDVGNWKITDDLTIKNGTISTLSGKWGDVTLNAIWNENSYTITANPNGGTISELNGWTKDGDNAVKIVRYTEKFATLPTAELPGYEFKGWSTTQGEATPNITIESIVDQTTPQDMTIYAVWNIVTYTITLIENGGSTVDDINYTIETSVTLPSTTKGGYTLEGWKVTDNGYEQDNGWNKTTSDDVYSTGSIGSGRWGNVSLTAQWDANSYTITLSFNNGAMDGYTPTELGTSPNALSLTENAITYYETNTFDLPTASHVTRTGYTFTGWKVTKTEGASGVWSNVDDNSVLKTYRISRQYGNVELEAQWVANTYTVKYDGNGATGGSTADSYHTYDLEGKLTKNGYVRTGYDFKGWAETPTGPKKYDDEQSVINLTAEPNGVFTLYSSWELHIYTVIANPNADSATINELNGWDWAEDGKNAEKKINNFTTTFGTLPTAIRTGYTFEGWADSATATSSNISTSSKLNQTNPQDMTIYAVWKVIEYTITLDLDDASNIGTGQINGYELTNATYNTANKTITYTIESAFNLPTETNTKRTGYTFTSWELGGDDTSWGAKGTQYGGSKISGKYGNITLKALWNTIDYKIKFELDSGEIYNGFINSYDASDASFSATEKETLADGTKLYEYIVTYNIENNFSLPTVEQTTKTGYTFANWEVSASDGNWGVVGTTYNSGAQIGEDKNIIRYGTAKDSVITLQAKWNINYYIIELVLDGAGEVGNAVLDSLSRGGNVTYHDSIKLGGETYKNAIKYTVEDAFDLPLEGEITKANYAYLGWSQIGIPCTTIAFVNQSTYYKSVVAGSYGYTKLQMNWNTTVYEITLLLDKSGEVGNAVITDYEPNSSKADYVTEQQGTALNITIKHVIKYTVEDEFDLPTSDHISKTGYTFVGWELEAGGTNIDFGKTNINSIDYLINVARGSDGNATLQLVWQADIYTIDFDMDMETNDEVGYGYIIDEYNPNSKNARFEKTETATSGKYDHKVKYTIEDAFNLPNITPTEQVKKDGYTFVGWTINTGTNNVNFGINGSGHVVSIGIGSYNNVELQANWQLNKYNITLDLDNELVEVGSAELKNYTPHGDSAKHASITGNEITYTIQDEFNLPTDAHISKIAYTFIGWSLVTGDETIIFDKTTIESVEYILKVLRGSRGEAKLQAIWQADIYVIELVLDGTGEVGNAVVSGYAPNGAGSYHDSIEIDNVTYTNAILYTIEDEFTLPSSAEITKDHYIYQGWTEISRDGTISFTNNGTYLTGVARGNYGYAKLQMNWNPEQFYIYFNMDKAGEVGAGSIINYTLTESTNKATYDADERKITYTIESTFNLPATNPIQLTKTGYTFVEWQVSVTDGNWGVNGTVYSAGALIERNRYGNQNESMVTLQAIWEAIPYTITIELDDAHKVGIAEILDTYDATDATFTKVETGATPDGTKLYSYSINYIIESEFYLPNASVTSRAGYNFVNWEIIENENSANDNWGANDTDYDALVRITQKYGNIKILATWELIQYYITLELDKAGEVGAGQVNGYDPAGDASYNSTTRVITYTIENEFNLPNNQDADGQVTKTAYKFMGWTHLSGDKLILTTQNTAWEEVVSTINIGSMENAEFIAIWIALEYDITFDMDNTDKEVGYGKIINYSLSEPETPKFTKQEVKDGDTPVLDMENNQVYTYKITYTIEDVFNLPSNVTSTQVSKYGYTFMGWSIVAESGDGVEHIIFGENADHYKVSVAIGSYGDITIEAIWETLPYTITLVPGDGEVVDYGPSDADTKLSYQTNEITYTIESIFNLPDRNQVDLTGYTAMEWELTSADGNWGTKGDKFDHGSEVKDKIGHIVLTAVWTENQYKIVIHANNDTSNQTIVKGVRYTNDVKVTNYDGSTRSVIVSGTSNQTVNVEWDLSYNRHVFVGWAMRGQDQVQTYEYITLNYTQANIEGDFGIKILEDGYSVSKVVEGSYEGVEVVNIYAIWLPIYTVTIEANGAQVYNEGLLTADQTIVYDNHFYQGYNLYTPIDRESFYTPGVGKRLHYYGYYIKGWIIKVGATQYYVEDDELNPKYYQWKETEEVTNYVKSGTNMQYLQGYIIATPQWKSVDVDVRYETKSNKEAYKSLYNTTKVSTVLFDSNYIVSMNESITKPNDTYLVQATDIAGYSVIYMHPHNDTNKIDESITIDLDGVWNYKLKYQQYTSNDVFGKDEGWYIVVEGYYSPDLYRIKLNLQLPYTEDNDFKLNPNGFDEVNESIGNLQARYASVILSENGYISSASYSARQHEVYKVGSDYYIYLLQDQIIEAEKIYNVYTNGKTILNPTSAEGTKLPTFEIAYYEMQYYYTFNNEFIANLYQIGTLDDDHKEYASNKITALGAKEINQNDDWTYLYCDTNETLGDNFTFNIYWYRNVVNVNINNLLDSNNTFNGYTLVWEDEQITASLQKHYKYHLIIYKQTDNVYSYTTYSFDDISLLQSGSIYSYSNIIELFSTKTSSELNDLGIVKQKSNGIELYFGNKLNVHAIDQSKDHSLDEFVGYRFDSYTYSTTNKLGNPSMCGTIDEFDNFINNGTSYLVSIDLRQYEYDEITNTTNYILDKDTIVINTIFTRISYVFNYQVTNTDYEYQPKYGNIAFEYQTYSTEKSKFEYSVNVNYDNSLTAKLNIRLGSELIDWRLVNDYIDLHLTDSQLSEIVVLPQFLRDNLYLNITGKPLTQYPSNATQTVGFVNAVCKDIDFEIKVNVKDLSKDSTIRTYVLSDAETNKLFTIKAQDGSNTNTITIENIYNIIMLSKLEADNYVFYYQDDIQYAIRSLYIAPSPAHSTNQLVNSFDYPAISLPNIAMNVNNSLLEGTVSYSQFTEVSVDNRYLNFYVEVAPTIRLSFVVSEHENDVNIANRQIFIEDVQVANADDKNPLELIQSTYLAYWGQQTLFRFVAENSFYSQVDLNIDYTDTKLIDSTFNVAVNGNAKYQVLGEAEIEIKLVPKTYSFEAYVEYNGADYIIDEKYGPNGELPMADLITPSGQKIFDNITISTYNADDTEHNKPDNSSGNVAPDKAIYYFGDRIYIAYTLNNAIKGEFNVAVFSNNTKVDTKVGNTYYVQFSGEDIEVRLIVTPKTQQVTLTTNKKGYFVGEIYAQVTQGSNSETITIQNSSYLEQFTSITLVNGAKLTIYIKENVGFEFTNGYDFDGEITSITTTQATGAYTGFKKFTLFNYGFNSTMAGYYYLQFEQIPINVEFEYYEVVPEIKQNSNAGQNYVAEKVDNQAIIQKGSVIAITKGTDNDGYRFNGYTYGAPQGDANAKELDLNIVDGIEQFVIDDNILDSLSTVNKVDNKLPLVIYVNYVRQYTFEYEYKCNENDVQVLVRDDLDNELSPNTYYDYDTEMYISIRSNDSKHVKIKVNISRLNDKDEVIGTESISTINMDKADIVDASMITTNLGNLSGFTVNKHLTSKYVIGLDIDNEKYNTVLNQKLFNTTNEEATSSQATNLIDKGDEVFNLYENIYYKLNATHEYGTEVNMTIYVLKPVDKALQYYTIDSVELNNQQLQVVYNGETTIDAGTSYEYSIKYNLVGESLPTELQLDLNFKALYYIELG